MTPLVTKYIFILLQKLLNIIIVVLNHHGLDQKCSKHRKIRPEMNLLILQAQHALIKHGTFLI